jgi:hypothetical protein
VADGYHLRLSSLHQHSRWNNSLGGRGNKCERHVYLYSTPLGALAYHTYNNLSSLDDYITLYPTFDTVIIRGVLSLRTDIWALETRSTNGNHTCKMWVAQTSIGGPYDLALQFCLSSQNGSDPYLIAGEDSML